MRSSTWPRRPPVEAGSRVVALDAPGFGRSPAVETDAHALDRLAGLCRAAADALVLTEPVLAGHSWGGAVVVAAAALRPHDARALVLLDGGHTDPGNWPDAQPGASFAELLAMLAAEPHPPTWDALAEILAESGDGQEWTLAAWREGSRSTPGRELRLACGPGDARRRAHGTRARASERPLARRCGGGPSRRS